MQDQHFETTLEQADQLLLFAEAEFCRPQEDVILDQLAQQINKATAHYLTAFLLRHAREVRPSMPVHHLLLLCAELDSKFQSFVSDPEILDSKNLLDMTGISNALSKAKKIRELTQINLI